MTLTNSIAATALLSILPLQDTGILWAAERSSVQTIKPMQGISFDVGSKRAVSYYLRDYGNCDLVLTLADGPDFDDAEPSFSATRFEATIQAGEVTRYSSSTGQVLEFACGQNAHTMSIRSVDQLAVGSGK